MSRLDPVRAGRSRNPLAIAAVVGLAGIAMTALAGGPGGVLELKSGPVRTADEPSLLAAAAPFDGARHYVLQLSGPMTPERQRALVAAGVHLTDAFPENAYIVTFDGTTPAALNALGFVAWAGAFRPDWKLDPDLGRAHRTPERRTLDRAGTPQVVVVSFEDADLRPIVDEITRLGGVAINASPCAGQWMIDARVPNGAGAALARLEEVQFIEDAPEGSLRNDSNRWILQSNVATQTPIWDHGIHGENQIGGHIDGTIKEAHCMFDDSVPVGFTHRKIVAMRNAASIDVHGTHTAGTFVGDAPPYNQYTTNDGMAFGARLSFSEVNAVFAAPGTLQPRLIDAHNDGARVHSNSWGDDGTRAYTTWCRQIDVFTYALEDNVVAFAVSNGGQSTTPENALNVLAVGASQDTPNQASFCSGGTGPTLDGRRKPEVYAPGCGTVSANSATTCGTTSLTGTSMACPAVSGCGLLVRQYFTEGWYPSGVKNAGDAFLPSGALIRAVLINSAVDMTGISGYPSDQEGWGRLLLHNSLSFSDDLRRLWVADVRNAVGLATGDYTLYKIIVNSSSTSLNITLASTDPAAAINAANPVVNNLDLEVLDPGATLYRGNVFTGGQSSPGGVADAKNNVEQVVRTAPATGVWTVIVRGTAVNGGSGNPFRQGYAVVATGDIAPCTPAAISDQPVPLSVRVSDPVTLSVGATGTALSYQWKHESANVGADAPSFSIDAAQFSDAGTYSVVVTNACSSATSTGALLQVFCPADFNQDGAVNGDDADQFYIAFQAGDPAADFDRNGYVNGEDADAFGLAFYNGC